MMRMRTINLNKTWNSLTTAIHRIKPHQNSPIKREALFALQILLSQYELAKNKKDRKLMNFYTDVLKTYKSTILVDKLFGENKIAQKLFSSADNFLARLSNSST